MLLVALHKKNNFELPTERVPEWYVWSADSAERGLATLEQLGLLTHTTRLKKAPLSPSGLTRRVGNFHYRATLPPGVDAERVEARFDNGVLTVRVPRPEQAKMRRIKIS